jgi:hypothetical protein
MVERRFRNDANDAQASDGVIWPFAGAQGFREFGENGAWRFLSEWDAQKWAPINPINSEVVDRA